MKMETRTLSNSVLRLGFWSAVLTAICTIIFIVAFGAYMPSLPTEWPGIESFASAFQSARIWPGLFHVFCLLLHSLCCCQAFTPMLPVGRRSGVGLG